MLGKVPRFIPHREWPGLNKVLAIVEQERDHLMDRSKMRRSLEDQRYEAMIRLDLALGVGELTCPDLAELQAAIEHSKLILTGVNGTNLIFKAQKKLRMLQTEKLLRAVIDGQDLAIPEIRKIISEATAVPYIDTSLLCKARRRLEALEAEDDLRAALGKDDPEDLHRAICAPALGSGMPNTDAGLMQTARNRLAACRAQAKKEMESALIHEKMVFRRSRIARRANPEDTCPQACPGRRTSRRIRFLTNEKFSACPSNVSAKLEPLVPLAKGLPGPEYNSPATDQPIVRPSAALHRPKVTTGRIHSLADWQLKPAL